jgi:hypothetical protein
LVKIGQDIASGQFVKRQSGGDFGVCQHAGQLVAHGLGGQPVECLLGQCLAQGFGSWVVEDKHVEDDVGVQDN